MSSIPSITKSDGMRMTFDVNPEADCCVKCMWFHWTFGCCPMGMTQEAKTEKEVAGTAPTMGPFPFSPCPCLIICGVGPCAGKWAFEQDAADKTKYNGKGSAFAGGCACAAPHDLSRARASARAVAAAPPRRTSSLSFTSLTLSHRLRVRDAPPRRLVRA